MQFLYYDKKNPAGDVAVKVFIYWGIRNGKQRFKCKSCGLLFQCDNKVVKDKNRFTWFIKWIMERQIYRFLMRDTECRKLVYNGYSKRFLSQAPEVTIRRLQPN